ncbi:uncharacterized protein LOC122876167 [Siniperca chuatsi]|uniref:uncharacterized protein LOC122876167 n=1 Tax=Siniperca chuatsi TaxID=119488 RepID=UPI001CE157FC|nr:uncharacterized protein LOC122876167 [Siniperca chuatsi]
MLAVTSGSSTNRRGSGSIPPSPRPTCRSVLGDLSDCGLSWPGSDSDLHVKKVSAPPHVHRLVPVGQTLAAAPEAKDDQQPPRSAQTLHLRNKSFEPVSQGDDTEEEHHTSQYKLDLKTGIDGNDWESLKRQTYLWRTHTQPVNSECERPSSSVDNADHVPYSLHPISIPSSHYQSKNSSTTGPAKCKNMDYINGIWQNYCQSLASTSKDGPHTSDDLGEWVLISNLLSPKPWTTHNCLYPSAKSYIIINIYIIYSSFC